MLPLNEIIEIVELAHKVYEHPWEVLGYTEEQWEDDLASHERGYELDRFIENNPGLNEALKFIESLQKSRHLRH